MRVLFCHDGPLKKDEFNNYYGVSYNDEVFSRYYALGEELIVAIRVANISNCDRKDYYSKIEVLPFRVLECSNTASIRGLLIDLNSVKRNIEEEIKKSDFIVARIPSNIGFIAINLAKKNKKPCLIELVACPWDIYWNHSIKGKLIAPIAYYVTKKISWQSSYTIYVTKNFLQKRYPTKGNSIGCSDVVLEKFNDEVLKKRKEKIINYNVEDTLIIGTVASVNLKYKGHKYIIKALSILKENGKKNFKYHIVGGGDPSYLKKIVKKYKVEDIVEFVGPIPHNQIFFKLDDIDIYVQPSRVEGFPRALIEAMSRGLPVFGANTGGIPELVEEKYIFSNTMKNTKEIIAILKSFNKKTMTEQAIRNYNEAKKYGKEIIEKRINDFHIKFRERNDSR